MEKLAEFKKLLQQKAKDQVPVQTEWVKVKAVDWDEKTMVATGEANDLEYDDILLGLGSSYRKPKIGSLATIGIINNSAAAFLIDCEEIEEFQWQCDSTKYTVCLEGFEVKRADQNLKDVMNDLIDEINKIKVIYGNTINVPEMIKIKQRLNTILK
ncbi:MAG: hypothetical protein V7767_00660 [Leeuwenhoekiella sp.]